MKEGRLQQFGFTFIEILIVIGMTMILSVASVPLYGNLQASTKLDENLAQIMADIRLTQARSESGFHNSAHGVYINPASKKVVIYQGNSYITRDVFYDLELILEDGVNVSTDIQDNDVNFAQNTAIPDRVGRIVLSFNSKLRTLEINNRGIVYEVI